MSRACLLLAMQLAFVGSAYAFECPKFQAEGRYYMAGSEVSLVFAGCDSAKLTDLTHNISYDFILDGKTHTELPQELYMMRSYIAKKGKIPDLSTLEKFSYISSLTADDDGASVHLKLTAIVRPKKSTIQRIHLKGHAAIYLRNRKTRNDCWDCKNQASFVKTKHLQLWLGNVEITKVEGGTKDEANAVLLKMVREGGENVQNRDKNYQPLKAVGDLIYVQDYQQEEPRKPTGTPTPFSAKIYTNDTK